MIRYVMTLFLLGAGVACVPAQVWAAAVDESGGGAVGRTSGTSGVLLFDNLAPNGGCNPAGGSPGSQVDSVVGFEAGAADDFVLPASPQCTWAVTGVRWTGKYWGGDNAGTITGFRVVFWPDSAGIPAGGSGVMPDLARALAVYDVSGNAHEIPSLGASPDAYDYWVDFPEALQARPGTRYWIEIQPTMDFPPQWGWHVTRSRTGASPVRYFDILELPAWTAISDPGDLAFQLIGEPRDLNCSDGNACTQDGCANGECVHTPLSCDDANKCTTDTCDPAVGCVNTAITCNDNNACTSDACHPGTGCTFTGITCDDGNACTEDSCAPATGCAHAAITCHDGNLCTEDTCDPSSGCVFTATTCDDKNACTADTCDPGKGCVFTDISCDDGSACTEDSCDPATGCIHATVTCDDGDHCTEDLCDPGKGCVFTPITCDDGDACTTDTCDPASGCVSAAVICDDGDPCSVDTCIEGECVHSAPPDFDGDTDADLTDFRLLQSCITAGTAEGQCACADLTGDGRMDLRDYAALQTAFSGEK